MRYQLQISAKILHWPRICACCCGPADSEFRATASRTSGVRVQRTKTMGWDVPYCTSCMRHMQEFASVPAISIVSAALGLVLWMMTAAEHPMVGAFLFIGGFAGAIAAVVARRARARSHLQPACATEAAAIHYLDWHGTVHTFVFASRSYVDAFQSANVQKTMSDVRVV